MKPFLKELLDPTGRHVFDSLTRSEAGLTQTHTHCLRKGSCSTGLGLHPGCLPVLQSWPAYITYVSDTVRDLQESEKRRRGENSTCVTQTAWASPHRQPQTSHRSGRPRHHDNP
nr:CMT1A duplicated region transcript 4 protein-like [Salvelinus alpinus]